MKNVELKKKFEEKYEKEMHELKSDLELEVKETNEGINAAYKFTHEGQEYGDNINIPEEYIEKDVDEIVDLIKMQCTMLIEALD
ncbi:hypothetical protein SAMN02910413_1685 [Pseudobutyrivibrio sp. C4]|uniref:hypothetical protein n=1 Tax=Pseudobutyrivibrio sp. C4 TaxID=1520803 RepID=UPI0008C4E713|nr:hypothetical protein [Pseudobutyrivibrio sp. C4]SET05930.1 hypothetical protein SAMN02910413_1685 [Pseudobutyrivibrio sp. C4]